MVGEEGGVDGEEDVGEVDHGAQEDQGTIFRKIYSPRQ